MRELINVFPISSFLLTYLWRICEFEGDNKKTMNPFRFYLPIKINSQIIPRPNITRYLAMNLVEKLRLSAHIK